MNINIFKNKSKVIKIIQIVLLIITLLYILETMFIRGMFTNIMLGCINIILAFIAAVISLVKKEFKLLITDLVIFISIFLIVVYLMYM